jgi:hypothetical protein
MNTTVNNKSAAESSVAATTEMNPYLQPVLKEQAKAPTNGNELHVEAEQDAAADRAADELKRKQRSRRRIVKAVIITLFFASVVIAIGLYRQRSTRVEYGQVGKQTQVLPPPPNVAATTARDSRSEQAIQDALRLTDDGQTSARKDQGAANAASSAASQTAHSFGNKTENPFVWPDSADALNKPEGSQKDSASVSANDQPPLRSQRSSETSLYVSVRDNERPHSPPLSSELPNAPSLPSKHDPRETSVVPPFGSMLPVRTIGGMYTLRSGGLARLELTRDMVGNGWSMKRGTILVGTTKGGEYDRAYVSLVGFIDPQSGKLVKLGGDVLGGDGSAGLKGKSRQVDSRWARVLSQVGNAALTLTGAFLGGRSNGTVILSDGARSPLINPLSGELDGVLGAQLDRNRQTGFVEVTAGTPGYVMVTDLPAAIQGVDAKDLNNQSLANLSNVDAIRPATGISEREFAELIANGSPEEIKARLQRMSPEMRKIALAVLER